MKVPGTRFGWTGAVGLAFVALFLVAPLAATVGWSTRFAGPLTVVALAVALGAVAVWYARREREIDVDGTGRQHDPYAYELGFEAAKETERVHEEATRIEAARNRRS